MKSLKRIIAATLSLVGILSLCACGTTTGNETQTTAAATEPTRDPNAPLCDGKTLRVLALTSSFGTNTTQYIYEIAMAEGATEVIVGRLYASGCTLEMHVSNANLNAPAYRYTKISTASNGQWSTIEGATMEYGLNDEAWDIIFMQQGAAQAGQLKTYGNYVDQLMAYVKKTKKTPTTGYIWNVLWAYQQDTDQNVYHTVFGGDQMYMYTENLRAAKELILPRGDFAALIPSGTAIQNARTSYFGDTLTRDTYHLNNLGRVISGYAMWAALTGKELTEINLGPVSCADVPQELILTDTDRQVILECVNNAFHNPWEVTPSAYPAE